MWARGGKPDPEVALDDLRVLGGNPEAIEEARAELEAGDGSGDEFEMWPCNQVSIEMFIDLETFWCWSSNFERARRIGLDHAGVESHLRMMKIKHKKRVWKDILVMECAALEVFNG